MTKAELVASIISFPDDAVICIGTSDGNIEMASTIDVESSDKSPHTQITILCDLEKLWNRKC